MNENLDKPLEKVIDDEKIKSIFSNICDIQAVHKNLLYELERISSQGIHSRETNQSDLDPESNMSPGSSLCTPEKSKIRYKNIFKAIYF